MAIIETWHCEVCKKERKDEDIAVISLKRRKPFEMQRNVKHCIDDVSCLLGAMIIAIQDIKPYDQT